MKTLSCLAVFLITYLLHGVSLAEGISQGWDQPFNESINRLKSGKWQPYPKTQSEFDKAANNAWAELKNKRKDWVKLLDPGLGLEQLIHPRKQLAAQGYIAKVFSTKAGTLILQLSNFPGLIIKIDNRKDSAFDENFRSYLSAFEKTQNVQRQAAPARFDHLYLPLESGRNSKEMKVRVVFSEKAPLFSEAEIDNMVLVLKLLAQAKKDATLLAQVKTMFSQLISYICLVDFDDINFRNLPFTIDGRLAPFDTDSFLAKTGVHSFVKAFFAHQVLSRDEVLALVDPNCPQAYAKSPKNLDLLYKQLDKEKSAFQANEKTLTDMLDFFSRTTTTKNAKFLSSLAKDADKKNAEYLEKIITEKINNGAGNKHLFGRRCEHVKDLSAEAASAIEENSAGTISFEQAIIKAREILQTGMDHQLIFGAASINQLKNYDDLRGFICF